MIRGFLSASWRKAPCCSGLPFATSLPRLIGFVVRDMSDMILRFMERDRLG